MDRAIVVGGGIAGLALSLGLLRQGRQVLLCEQAAAFAPVGAGITLSPSACRALDWLGLGEALSAAAAPASPPVLRDWATGRAGKTMATAAHLGETRRIARSDLHAILLDAARRYPGFAVMMKARLARYEQDAAGVIAVMQDGRAVAGAHLFAADGARSTVRQIMIGDGAADFAGYAAWRFMLPATKDAMRHMAGFDATITAGPAASLTCYTVSRGALLNCVAITRRSEWAAEGWSEPGEPDELAAAFADAHGDARALIDLARGTRLYRWGLFDRPVTACWHDRRVVLLGDAAHPVLPFLAFGAGLAIEDAVVLARAVAAHGEAAGFARYAALRVPRAREIHAASRQQAEAFSRSASGDLPPGSPMLSPAIFTYDPVALPL